MSKTKISNQKFFQTLKLAWNLLIGWYSLWRFSRKRFFVSFTSGVYAFIFVIQIRRDQVPCINWFSCSTLFSCRRRERRRQRRLGRRRRRQCWLPRGVIDAHVVPKHVRNYRRWCRTPIGPSIMYTRHVRCTFCVYGHRIHESDGLFIINNF